MQYCPFCRELLRVLRKKSSWDDTVKVCKCGVKIVEAEPEQGSCGGMYWNIHIETRNRGVKKCINEEEM